ncbi:MAG: serine/threonine-protein kinase [Oscillatoria sp. PMC 1068.18]|nr:serine/threonine-protein kinase [Oscillatoria sp. PMC 1076.18]MEC4988312.1 serine/threonine-protein kinase [Oscillatoria sp. PMC 1068.18]
MSYCLNPDCPKPKNPQNAQECLACGTKLLLRDRYLVSRILGQGGFGATFLASDRLLPGNPCCVIKQLRPNTTAPHMLQMARELFNREAETLGRIGNHPQVPRLLDYFEVDQQFYLVQEYVKGYNFQQEIKKNGPMSEAGVRQFLSEILPLLQYIHAQQVIHRDIKPANLIRREQDRKLVLIDFGAVKNKVDSAAAANTSDQTALTGFAVGTPGFAPPEQMMMRPVYASDVYAVGVTCVYLLTGKSPKDLNYNPSTGEMVWQDQVHVSDHFANVLRKMLEVSVRDRYQNADDVLRALDLEPYLDSLAQGMITPGSNPNKSNNGLFDSGDFDAPSSPSAATSATAKLAMAIKKRKSRQNNTGVSRNLSASGGSFGRLTPPGNFGVNPGAKNNSGSKKRASNRMDSEAVLTSYKKGRRDFTDQNLSLLDLQEANLSKGIFHQSKLTKVNLSGANLTNADFGKANLTNANLRDANLGRAYLSYTNLEGADLRGADLSFAYLNYANLKNANLCGANLTNAKVTEEQLAQAKTNWATIMPNGKRGFW